MNKRFGIIGSGSMVATQTCEQLEQSRDATLTKADLHGETAIDITNVESTANFFEQYGDNFEWVILFSAYTDVGEAEKQRQDGEKSPCWKINVEGVKNVTDACKKHGKKLIFISTDFVFDGEKGPYSEEDHVAEDPSKVTFYGLTKIEGERYIQDNLEDGQYLILRIAYPYSGVNTGKDDLILKDVHWYEQGQPYGLFEDQSFTPTYILDIAKAIIRILENNQAGIFHVASPSTATQYEFALELLRKVKGENISLKTASLEEAIKNGAYFRPLKGGLKVDKITSLGFASTDWRKGIELSIPNLT